MEQEHRVTEPILQKSIAAKLDVPVGDVQITGFDVAAGAAKGENFLCVLKATTVTAKVKGSDEERSFDLMIKCAPMNEFRTKFLKEV